MEFVLALVVLGMIGAAFAALMNTEAGQIGCGCITSAFMLAGIGAILVVFAFLGYACVSLVF